MYQRSTTATRREAQRKLDLSRMIHVSQMFRLHTVTDPETGVVVQQWWLPQFLNVLGTKAKGRTYTTGRNYRKRICRSARLNHVHMERHHSLRPGSRKNWYAACVGA